MVSSYREDKDGFSKFVKDELGFPENRLSYVWEKFYAFFRQSPDEIRNKVDPEKIFNNIRRAVKRRFNDYQRKFNKDPILRKIEDKLRREGKKGIDKLFAQIFPFNEVSDDLYSESINETYNSFEDIGILENIIAIRQACQKLKGVKPERVDELRDLLITRTIYEISYSEAGILLGWSKEKVEKIRVFYKRHEESFQKILIS
jgi:hypothetical protein